MPQGKLYTIEQAARKGKITRGSFKTKASKLGILSKYRDGRFALYTKTQVERILRSPFPK